MKIMAIPIQYCTKEHLTNIQAQYFTAVIAHSGFKYFFAYDICYGGKGSAIWPIGTKWNHYDL